MANLGKTALAMTQKAAIGKLAAKVCSAGKLYLSGCGNDHVSDSTASDSHGVTDCGHKRFRYCELLADNSNCTIIHTGGAVCRENRSCVGEAAATMLRSLMIDQVFISASSWSVRGIYASGKIKSR